MKMDTDGGAVCAADDDDLPDGLPAKPKLPGKGFRVLDAVVPSIPKSGVPTSYAVALGLLAGCLVLMPLIYLGLVAFLGWLAVWHLVQTFTSLQYGPYFVFHLPMAILGLLLVVFLTKPIFFRPKKKNTAVVTLTADEEPALFEAVHRLCAEIGSQFPTRIEVDCEPNAFAGYRRAVDAVKGGELLLRVGLPLAASMSIRQFLGVISHELGHFNQVRGMTASYLVRRLNGFFVRVVFHKDRIDKSLDKLKAKRHGGAKAIYWLTFAFVEPMRGILWAMMVAGELMCCGVLRRMEHDADGVEAYVSGVEDFARTSRLLLFLDIACKRSHSDLSDDYDRGRLVDDLPRLIVSNARQLSEHRDDLLKILDDGKTNWFDTHPCHHDRIDYIQQVTPATAGLGDAATLPASLLFSNFSDVCQRATVSTYNNILGVKRASAAKLIPVDEVAVDHADRRADLKALARFFRGHILSARPVFPHLEVDHPITDPVASVTALLHARNSLETTSAAAAPLIETVKSADAELPSLRAQLQLAALFPGNPKAESMRRAAGDTARQLVPARAAAVADLEMFEFSASERLTLAVRLLSSSVVTGKLTDDEIFHAYKDIERNLPVLKAIEACAPITEKLIEQATLVQALASLLQSARNNWQAHRAVNVALGKAVNAVIASLRQLQAATKSVPFPFAHASEGITVAATIVPTMPDPKNLSAIFNSAVMAIDRCRDLTFRSLAVLARWSERLEAALNFEPLPDPVAEKKSKPKTAAPEAMLKAQRERKYWIGYGARATAGTMLVTLLVWFSVSPPTLPTMPWEAAGDRDTRYQPAPFRIVSSQQPNIPVFVNPNFNHPGNPGITMPQTPNMPTPNFGGYQGRAVVQQPGTGIQYMPPGYVPPTHAPPAIPTPWPNGVPGGNTPGGYSPPRPYTPPTMPQTPHYTPGGMPGGGGGFRGGGGGRR